MEPIIKIENISYSYKSHSEDIPDVKALTKVSLKIYKGEFLVVLGRNGSGKSTLARHMNALLIPDEGHVTVKGMDTQDDAKTWDIRRTAGMVFQNPDNQIVSTIVEEDVAFGPENLGVPPEEIRKRVDWALRTVGIQEFAKHAPHLLSGGQKQRVAIAGVLAMHPECLILDEATAMLDPLGRREVLGVLRKLNKEEGMTIILITHHMDEAALADRVVVLAKGSVAAEGTPAEIFSDVKGIKGLGLDVPQVTELFYELGIEGIDLPLDILTVDKAFEILERKLVQL